MLLKRLQIKGFKSFAERVSVEFGAGVTAVVGPNGSGKSNIADAILWVLGEQNARTLRAESNTEVIFAGSAHRKPLGMAEVSLTVDNSDGTLPSGFSEVTVARRLYRSGDSEYLINGVACRLKDIVELFMDTGVGRASYAILTQSEVDAVLSARVEERRALFEEAAGIQKYRRRKREALQRLDNTESNLVRVHDILSELREQSEPLRAQAETALEYLALQNRLRAIETDSLWYQWLQATRQRDEASVRLAELTERADSIQSELAACEALSSDASGRASSLQGQMDALRERQQQMLSERERADARRQLAQQRIGAADDTRETLQEERAQWLAQYRQLSEQAAATRQALQDTVAQRQEITRQRDRAAQQVKQARDLLNRALQIESRRAQAAAAAQARIHALERQSEEQQADIGRLQHEADQIATRHADAQREAAERLQAVQAAQQTLAEAKAASHAAEQALAEARRQSAARQDEHQRVLQQLTGSEARLVALQEAEAAHEGLHSGVRAVLERYQQDALDGSCVLVADALKPLPGYVTAIEVALGGSAQDLIADSAQTAKAAIGWLKQHGRGRATFLPLDGLHPLAPPNDLHRAIDSGLALGFADSLVECAPEHDPVALHLLGRVLVARDYDAAAEICRRYSGWTRVVTLEGELFQPGGAVTGGRMPGRAAGLVSRRAERQELETAVEQLRQDAKSAESRLDEARRLAAAAESAARDRASEWQRCEKDHVVAEREAHAANQRIEARQREVVAARTRVSRAEERHAQLIDELNRLRAASEGAPAAGDTPDVEALQTELESATQALQHVEVEAGRLREHESALRKELDSLTTRAADAERQAQQRSTRLNELTTGAATDRQALVTLAAELERLTTGLQQLESEINAVRGQHTLASAQARDAASRMAELGREQAKLGEAVRQMQSQEQRAEMSRVQAATRLFEEYDVDVTDGPPEGYAPPPREVSTEINRLRRELRAMGAVNTGAAEEYQRLMERLSFLERQQADLQQARIDVMAAITEIDNSTRGRFVETFERVQLEFDRLFRELFGGGRARLTLTAPDDILETGVDIEVELPGKRRQNLSLLSGGERSLTAAALLFAFLKVKPSPFCVLDEVDAALDGSNVDKFADMLRQFATRSQVIVVTHNAATMEHADVWYGVTMQEPGVSKVLSYRAPIEALPSDRTVM